MRSPGPPGDYCDLEGAFALAAKLDRYWHERGFTDVQHWVEPQPAAGKGKVKGAGPIFLIRSNLINGMPPPAENV